jgi:hypothetical protein
MQMMRYAVVAGALLAFCGVAPAQTNDDLRARLDQALKTIEDLQARVKALEQQRPAAPVPAAAVAAPATSSPPALGAPVVAPTARADADAKAAGQARVEVYGQAMLDAIYDFKRMNPEWNATMRPSQIPVTCPGDAGCGQDGATIFSVRQSSLGFRGFIPTAMGTISTDLAFDLFGTNGGTQVHWLRAWAELGRFGVGQTDSLFMDMDVFPNVIDYWGPSGMVFVRNPQLRYSALSGEGLSLAFSLEAPNSVIDTGKLTAVDPSLGAGITGWSRLPDGVASLRFDRDWGHFRASGLLRQVGYQNSLSASGKPSGELTGYGLNLSGSLKLFGKDRLTWQVAGGRAIASYINDGGVDLAPGSNFKAETVPSLGWLLYYGHAWNDQWSTALGYSEHRQDNTGGQLGSAFRRGSYSSLNLLYAPLKNVTTGAEFIWGDRENKDGSSASDYRLQFSSRVTF